MIPQKKSKCLDVTINYIDEGKGETIVFIHNGGGFLEIWCRQIEYFSKTHRVIALDLPGFGESTESTHPYSLDYNISVIHQFFQNLKIKNIILAGNCIGASLAIQYKNLYPENVRKLVLINICPGERLIRSFLLRKLIFKTGSKLVHIFLKRLITIVVKKTFVKKKFPGILFGKSPDKNSFLFLKYEDIMKQAKQTRSRLNLLFASDSYTLKHFLNDNKFIRDELLIWGECNKVASLKRQGFYHQELCGIKNIHIIKDSGHLLMYESAEETNQLMQKHIEN